MRCTRFVCLLLFAATINCPAQAQTSVPFNFTPGTQAKASEVNANFQSLIAAIDNLSARVSKLEGTSAPTDADVVGTYKVSFLQVGIGWVAPGATPNVEAISYDGTWTALADHTWSATFTGHKNDDTGPHPDDGSISGTWSLNNGDVTFLVPGGTTVPVHCLAACRLMMGTSYGSAASVNDEGQNLILILVRSS